MKECEEISCTSLQSSKSSFCKIQIFKFAYSALPLFYSLFRVKSSLHRVVYTKRVKQSEEISCISLQSSKRSFRKIQIFKFAYSALSLFYSLFRLKSSLHRVVYTKRVRESEEIRCISLQSSKRSFRKTQIFRFAYSALPLFYSLFRLSNRGMGLLWRRICSFQYMIIHFVSFLFVLFRFVSQNTVSPVFLMKALDNSLIISWRILSIPEAFFQFEFWYLFMDFVGRNMLS